MANFDYWLSDSDLDSFDISILNSDMLELKEKFEQLYNDCKILVEKLKDCNNEIQSLKERVDLLEKN